jgi:ABC-2 type transport system ATP-binding protein
VLKVKNITKYYGPLKAVDNLSFTVNRGDIFGLLGVNGSGKTTTFRIIMGLLDANGGSVTLDDKEIDYSLTDNIGFLTEERSLLTKLTVREQAEYYGILKGMKKAEIDKELDKWLERFGISGYKHRKIKELSKGNQQKIQFITAIINNPKLLILDEPFSGLDPINTEMFKEVIKEFEKKGSMIIFSSHRMEHVELFCDKLVILVDGRSVLEGSLKDIKKEYRKKNIIISGDIDPEIIKTVKGVLGVVKIGEEYEVKIKHNQYVEGVFEYVSTCSNVTKFVVEEPSLNEIFVAKVGESYEQ